MGKKLSDYAKERGIGYRAAWNRFKAGRIPGAWQDETGHVIVPDPFEQKGTKAVIYARVSSAENRPNLDSQAERLGQYATARGWQVIEVVKETGAVSTIIVKNWRSFYENPPIGISWWWNTKTA